MATQSELTNVDEHSLDWAQTAKCPPAEGHLGPQHEWVKGPTPDAIVVVEGGRESPLGTRTEVRTETVNADIVTFVHTSEQQRRSIPARRSLTREVRG